MEIRRYDATLVNDVCGNKDVLIRERRDGLFVLHSDHLAALTAQFEEIDRLKKRCAVLLERQVKLQANLALADKMRGWFMHTVPEWDKSTQKAIDAYDAARSAIAKTESMGPQKEQQR